MNVNLIIFFVCDSLTLSPTYEHEYAIAANYLDLRNLQVCVFYILSQTCESPLRYLSYLLFDGYKHAEEA